MHVDMFKSLRNRYLGVLVFSLVCSTCYKLKVCCLEMAEAIGEFCTSLNPLAKSNTKQRRCVFLIGDVFGPHVHIGFFLIGFPGIKKVECVPRDLIQNKRDVVIVSIFI